MTLKSLDEGRVTVGADFLPLLLRHGLDTFDKVMSFAGGRVMRDFPGRRTVRLELASPSGAPLAFFLKRYEPEYLSTGRRILRRLRWPSAQDEARREWDGIEALRAVGIRTATPVAYGQRTEGGLVCRSFLITEEIRGGQEGDRYLSSLPAAQRGRFLERAAELARRLHAAGWVHKDLYVSHILVAPGETPGSDPELFLIDLQRLMKTGPWRERWRAKDLGALAYSALKAGASPRDLFDAWRTYCGVSHLTDAQRHGARRVLRRVAWLKTRTPKHDKDFQQLA
jgi:lipopolysaccharide core heptose(I) kinase